MRMILLPMSLVAACWAHAEFGTWTLNVARSTFEGDNQPRSLTVRMEPHVKGQVFTMDRIEADGRMMSASTILYLDGTRRDLIAEGTSSPHRWHSCARSPRFERRFVLEKQ